MSTGSWIRSDGWLLQLAVEHGLVDLTNLFGHVFMAEQIGAAATSFFAQSMSQLTVGGQSDDGGGQWFDLSGGDSQSGLFVDTDFRCTIDIKADHRFAGDQSLWQHSCQSFPDTRVGDDVGRVDVIGDFVGWHQPGEGEVVRQTQFLQACFEL